MNKDDRIFMDEIKTELKETNTNLTNLGIEMAVNNTTLETVRVVVNDHLHEHRTLRIATYSAFLSMMIGLIILFVKTMV